MIFLGAGASKELGVKTTQELITETVDKLKRMGYASETAGMVCCLERFGMTPDFESICSVIEGLVDIKKGVKDAGPLTAFACKNRVPQRRC